MKAVALVLLLALTIVDPAYDFIEGNNLFTADIYKEQIKLQDGNILVSPFAAEIVLAATQYGAKTKTKKEIGTILHFPDSKNTTKWKIYNYLTSLKSNDSQSYALHTANKIYIKKNLTLKNTFQDVVTRFYKTQIESIDFSQNNQAAKTINDWVEQQTYNKVNNIIEPSHLDASTALVLVNALYFKGGWVKLMSSRTTNNKFYKTSTDVVQIDTTYEDDERFNYFESAKLKAKFLELPLNDSPVSLVIALPDEKDGLANLEKHAYEVFSNHQFEKLHVILTLPNFKIENKIDLKRILKKLGMNRLFSDQANLSGIAGNKGDLSVSEILQKTSVEIESVKMRRWVYSDAGLSGRRPKEFIVDHPFIFFIKINNAIIFAGRIVDPSQ